MYMHVFLYTSVYIYTITPRLQKGFRARWFRIEWDTIVRSQDSRAQIIDPKRRPICTLLRKQGVMKHDEALVYSIHHDSIQGNRLF